MRINEKRMVLRSKECKEGRIFEVGEEIPDGWARQLSELPEKAPAKKKKVAKKKAIKKKAK